MRRFMHGSIIALGLVLALQQPSFAQAPAAAVTELRSGLEQAKLAGVVDWLKADVERGRIPGAVVLIARDGKIVLHEAVGWADKDKKVPMALNSIHPIASSTKLITTVAALRLIEENKLAHDDADRDLSAGTEGPQGRGRARTPPAPRPPSWSRPRASRPCTT